MSEKTINAKKLIIQMEMNMTVILFIFFGSERNNNNKKKKDKKKIEEKIKIIKR